MTFNNLPVHFGQCMANQELEWLPTDTEDNYTRLIQNPKHQQYFRDQGWNQPRAITYKFNSYGFRCAEFESGPYVMALGCSFAVGIGLPISVTWPELLGRALDLQVVNLSWGGYSADTCYRLAEYWIPALRPRYVCMLTPPVARLELLLESSSTMRFEVFMPNSTSSIFKLSDPYLKHWYANNENAAINQRKNERAVKQLCSEFGIPCTIVRAHDVFSWNQQEMDSARDFMHAGPKQHKLVAGKFIDAYEK